MKPHPQNNEIIAYLSGRCDTKRNRVPRWTMLFPQASINPQTRWHLAQATNFMTRLQWAMTVSRQGHDNVTAGPR